MYVHFALGPTGNLVFYQCSFNIVPVPRNGQVSATANHPMLFWSPINSFAADWIWAGGCVRASPSSFFRRRGLCLSGMCCCCVHRRATPCLCVFVRERHRGSGPFLLYNHSEGFLYFLQKPFPLLFQMTACSWELEEQCFVLILWVTGESCFIVPPHCTLYSVRPCMPVHVQICFEAVLEHILH